MHIVCNKFACTTSCSCPIFMPPVQRNHFVRLISCEPLRTLILPLTHVVFITMSSSDWTYSTYFVYFNCNCPIFGQFYNSFQDFRYTLILCYLIIISTTKNCVNKSRQRTTITVRLLSEFIYINYLLITRSKRTFPKKGVKVVCSLMIGQIDWTNGTIDK